jgi:hypothetical protein
MNRRSFGDLPMQLLQAEIDEYYTNPVLKMADEAKDPVAHAKLLKCAKYPPTLECIPATGAHTGVNGGVPAHRDCPRDVGWTNLFWLQVCVHLQDHRYHVSGYF